MALGEIGMFLPPESAYGTPGAFSQALRAEATKRAAYLSDMDQFYAQLEESKRQFQETLSFKEKSWEEQLGLSRDQLEQQKQLGYGQLLLGLINARTSRIASRRRTGGSNYLGRDERLDLLRQIWKDKRADYDPSGQSSWLGQGFSYPSAGSAGMYE